MPVVLAAVIVPLLGGGWRGSLEFWSVASALSALVIFVARPRGDGVVAQHRRWMPDWRDPLLWKIGLVTGANNQLYFCTNAFLPGLLLQTGHTDLIRPALSALNAGQLPGSILLLVADTFARVIAAPAELPIGIVTAAIGAPFFLSLLLRQRALVGS